MGENEKRAAMVRKQIREAASEKEMPYSYFEILAAIETLIHRIQTKTDLNSYLIYKGGFVSLRVYESNRFTRDLDALASHVNFDQIQRSLNKIQGLSEDGFWFGELETKVLPHQSEFGGRRFMIRYSVGTPKKSKRAARIDLDIGIGDTITPGPVKAKLFSFLGYENLEWEFYPAETIVAEKLEAMVRHSEFLSRAKDLYDLWKIIPQTKRAYLKGAIEGTFRYRSTPLPSSFSSILKSVDKEIVSAASKKLNTVDGSPVDIKIVIEELLIMLEKNVDPLFGKL